MPERKEKLCFVLMPFSDDLKPVYWSAIKPACDQTGFHALRVDELKGPFNIHREIIERIFRSEVIIADLTKWNPNVFYEMGVAHAIGNKTIMIIQKQDKLPFDVNNYNCIMYEQTDAGLQLLMHRIVESLQHFEAWRHRPTNPVQDFKPHEAFIPKSEMDKLHRQLQEKDKLLRAAEADGAELQRKIENLRSQPETLPPPFILRSQPLAELAIDEALKMFKGKELFDSNWNKQGKGLQHQFETVEQQGQMLVVDHATGLMWKQSGSSNQMNYADAENYIRDLNAKRFAGYNNWRLPTLEEAMSLMEPKKHGNLYIDPLFDQTQKWIWTTDKESADMAWVVDFSYGSFRHGLVDVNYIYVRAVRGGQSNI